MIETNIALSAMSSIGSAQNGRIAYPRDQFCAWNESFKTGVLQANLRSGCGSKKINAIQMSDASASIWPMNNALPGNP